MRWAESGMKSHVKGWSEGRGVGIGQVYSMAVGVSHEFLCYGLGDTSLNSCRVDSCFSSY